MPKDGTTRGSMENFNNFLSFSSYKDNIGVESVFLVCLMRVLNF